MAFFNKLLNIPEGYPSNTDNIELALQLFNTLSLGYDIDAKYKQEINKILNSLKDETGYIDRQLLLNKIIELVGEPQNSKQRFIIAKAYAWSKAAYRKEAIKYLELYLSNELYEDEYKYCHHDVYGRTPSIEEEKNIHIADMLQYLGKSYEGEYEFEKALTCYQKVKDLTYFWPHTYCNLVKIYTKMNKLSEALKICKEAKKSIYYKKTRYKDELLEEYYTDDTFKTVIDNLYKDTKEKIEKRLCI